MTASELAFLALGILFGAASGAALIALFGTRLPRREIRVTVTRDAVPRRSETLSQDAFVTSPAAPAPGGPADRRGAPRQAAPDASDHPAGTPMSIPARPAAPVGIPVGPGPLEAPASPRDRTIVPNGPGRSVPGAPASPTSRPRVTTTVPIGAADAAASRVEDVEAAPALAVAPLDVASDPGPQVQPATHRGAGGTAMERILRGDHRAMAEVLDEVAGPDGPQRREWEGLLGGLVEAMAAVAVSETVIDFPMGTAFWDSFTIEQCRRIVGALATMGYAYDGDHGWLDGRAPAYRDLTLALADIGIDPRRIRAWPNSSDIAQLFVGARPAPEELLAAAGPDYEAEDVRALVGTRADELADLWLAWDAVRPALFEEHLTPA